jgi:hypothetical protein
MFIRQINLKLRISYIYTNKTCAVTKNRAQTVYWFQSNYLYHWSKTIFGEYSEEGSQPISAASCSLGSSARGAAAVWAVLPHVQLHWGTISLGAAAVSAAFLSGHFYKAAAIWDHIFN